jgi:GNAT superfamily N-acetyltransferase
MDSGTYPPHPAGEESESIFFELYDNKTEIGGYRLDRGMEMINRNQWALNDRLVLDEYRDQGFGAALMIATESFLQSQADLQQSPQKLTANVGQPSVLLMLLNNGFIASSPEDQKRVDRVLRGDLDLELDYAVVNEEGVLSPEIFKDLYCFEKGTFPKTEINALRINLEKNFEPKITQVGVTQKTILDSVQAALSAEK